MMATPATHNRESTTPTCQNCQTSTTPLWRRDEYGAVLCNACGLFLKLHGRPRPSSLKTDVIKSRNRVKTMRPDLAAKKKQQQLAQQAQQQAQANQQAFSGADPNGFDFNTGVARQAAQRGHNGHGGDSPGSRGATPSLYNPALPVFHGLDDAQFQSGAIHGFNMSGTPPNRPTSPLNGDRHLDAPQTQEQLIAANAALKTRVSELEFINELFRGRLGQLEQDQANATGGQDFSGQSDSQLRSQLEESHRREEDLKRRIDELEFELKGPKGPTEADDAERPAKKLRVSDPAEQPQEPEVPPTITDPALETSAAEPLQLSDTGAGAAPAPETEHEPEPEPEQATEDLAAETSPPAEVVAAEASQPSEPVAPEDSNPA